MGLKPYLQEILEPSLLFGLFPSLLGIAAARHFGIFNPYYAALIVAGVAFSQIAVNLIDDYVDFTSGLDRETVKTKFSGGSPLFTEGLVDPRSTLAIGLCFFAASVAIGAYFVLMHALLLPIVIIGGASVLFYARYLTKVPFLSEPLNSINFALVGIGSFIAMGGRPTELGMIAFAAAASGLQVGAAAVVNYVPDRKADVKYGRKGGVVMIGSLKGAAAFYLAIEAAAVSSAALGVGLAGLPPIALAVVLALPSAVGICTGIANFKDVGSYERVMVRSRITELSIMLLMVIVFL